MRRHRPHIALATCAALPELDDDERLLVEPLRQLGARVSPAVWDDPSVDWDRFELVVVRSTWDYTARRDEFVAWAHGVPRLANSADVIEWNTDKRYLAELEASGIPVVPTRWLNPSDPVDLPASGSVVIKPSVGAGSLDVERFAVDDRVESGRARRHTARLQASGRTVMVQPYFESVDRLGEAGLVMLRGEFSHALNKSAMLGAPRESVAGLYKSEVIEPRQPSAAELELAGQVLAVLCWPANALLYARVDMLAGPGGEPIVIELELTEPSLFMSRSAGSAERFAAAVMAHLEQQSAIERQ
jgi:glutathione synthase/RimK-type ligase-like ATP-grasp enzyme